MSPRVNERGRIAENAPTARKQRNTALVWTLTLLGLAAVVGAILFAAIKLGDAQATVTVPSELQKNVDVATRDLQDNHLKATIQPVNDPTAGLDTVVDQNPAPGKSVARESTVVLKVNRGATQKLIPADIILGKTQADVNTELTNLGFQVQAVPQANSAPSGTVFDSSPKPGTSAPVGSVVKIFVSSGPAPQPVPSVRGLSLDAATKTLVQDGFVNINPAISEPSSSVSQGNVTRTDPPAGKVVSLDTHITVYVSTGAQTVSMPNKVGETKATATDELIAAGFSVSTLNRVDDANVGRVVDQNPRAGTQVPPDQAVVLYIGVASSATSTTTTPGPTTTTTKP